MFAAIDIFVLLGPPGAGKGTLSQFCVSNFGWQQVAAGNLCRKHIAEGTKIGLQIAHAIASGNLAAEGLVSDMVFDWLNLNQLVKPIILDGFPRTITQAEMLNQFFQMNQDRFKLNVVRLKASDDHVLTRMLTRYVCERSDCQMVYSSANVELQSKDGITCDKCAGGLIKRQDDSLGSIRERLHVYHQHENGLIGYYSQIGQSIIEIDVERELSVIFNRFVDAFGVKNSVCMTNGIN